MLSVAAVVLMAVGVAAQAKPNFAGEWKLMVARGQGEPGVDLTVIQSASAIAFEYRGGVKLTCKLGSAVSQNVMPGGGNARTDQIAKAVWAGNNLVVTATTGAGEETRTFSLEDGYLVVDVATPAGRGEVPTITKMVYERYERGFGG
ncbi:MAG: hypothetical protein IT184_02565 [Acidobacteria bacterium]|nr:hypothetical protein [Acidobacteriota bacterium]